MYTEAEKFIEPYKSKISPELLSNPQFMRELSLALLSVKERSGSSFANLDISEDGKRIAISRTYIQDNPNIALKNNQSMFFGSIELKENENSTTLESLRSNGTFYDAKAYEPFLPQEERGKLEGRVTVQSSVSYEHSIIDQDGIYLAQSSASDLYPLTDARVGDEGSLRDQLLSKLHKPTFVYGGVPQAPMFSKNMSVSTFYRDYRSLGVVQSLSQTNTPNGVKDQKYEIYGLNTEYPQFLRTYGPIGHMEQGMVISDNPSMTGISLSELKAQYAPWFQQGVETSETHKYDPKLYEILKQRAEQGLEAYSSTTTSVTR